MEPVDWFTTLPSEILVNIFSSSSLCGDDISRLSQTCVIFSEVATLSRLWKSKYALRWPYLSVSKFGRTTWREEYAARYKCGTDVWTILSTLSEKCYTNEELPELHLAELCSLIVQYCLDYVVDELYEVLAKDSKADLTVKYYAKRVMEFLKRITLKEKLKNFLEKPDDVQLLEDGAMIISQWCQPLKDFRKINITPYFDKMAFEVMDYICKIYPDHPAKQLQRWPSTGGWCATWQPNQRRLILQSLHHVMYGRHNFRGDWESSRNQYNSYLEEVIRWKQGISLLLAIVYSAVAWRLGVFCEPVSFPRHILLRFLERPQAEDIHRHTYVDCFNGQFLSREECLLQIIAPFEMSLRDRAFEPVAPKQVLKRMIQNLQPMTHVIENVEDTIHLRNSLEMVWTLDNFMKVRLSKLEFQDIAKSANFDGAAIWQAKTKLRSDSANTDVAYSVGRIMHHTPSKLNCVIAGWDPVCCQNSDWIQRMGVMQLNQHTAQPFYSVLIANGPCQYVAQETLEAPQKLEAIAHPNIGRFFKSFNGFFYVANAQKEMEYPEDAELTQKAVQ